MRKFAIETELGLTFTVSAFSLEEAMNQADDEVGLGDEVSFVREIR